MTTVKLVRDTYLVVRILNGESRLGLRTKDIGFTIGTEIFWWETGRRIAAYRPGTRYAGYAEELAAVLVDEAVSEIRENDCSGRLIEEAIRSHKDVVSRPWNPDEEPGEDW
ncbi:hypothetical protein RGQ21_67730 [Kitasatospora aureofaciens]|nr:hypothetical protein RGQ21_67730 [Kitasatospora aureofaciens]